MIRVLVCEDQGALVRAGYVTIFNAQPDMEVVGEGRRRPLGRGGRPAAEPRRDRGGHPDARGTASAPPATWPGPAPRPPRRSCGVMTSNVDEYVYEGLRAGASGFLLKGRAPGRTGQRRPDGRGGRLRCWPPRSPAPSSATTPNAPACSGGRRRRGGADPA